MRANILAFTSFLALGVALGVSPAKAVDVSFTNTGVVVGGSTVFSASLTGLGLTEIAAVTIKDSNSGVGGAGGIFSGFDLDALFLDIDGNIATTGDQFTATSYSFIAGTTRPTFGDSSLEPTFAHPGPTFGSTNATTIDHATATLSTMDGVSIADVNSAFGFLTLGDGGQITAIFDPKVSVGLTLFLLAGEVGGNGEDLTATVTVSDTAPGPAVPLPAALPLFAGGLGVMGLIARRRKQKAA